MIPWDGSIVASRAAQLIIEAARATAASIRAITDIRLALARSDAAEGDEKSVLEEQEKQLVEQAAEVINEETRLHRAAEEARRNAPVDEAAAIEAADTEAYQIVAGAENESAQMLEGAGLDPYAEADIDADDGLAEELARREEIARRFDRDGNETDDERGGDAGGEGDSANVAGAAAADAVL